MFPYPSGAGLHVGHPEGYTATDILARYKRMRGFNVLHPMGWDAFGLPAEQYASRPARTRAITTQKNIDTFRRQIKSLGFCYDWDREVDTTDPDYFKWTQWIFLELYDTWYDPEHGNAGPADQQSCRSPSCRAAGRHRRSAAYRDASAWPTRPRSPVNWCPALGTVLANEEVIDGKSERGGHPVVRMPLRQWMLRITAYAERLIDDLEHVDWSAADQGHAAQLDRPERRGRGRFRPDRRLESWRVCREPRFAMRPRRDPRLHHPARHAVRRDLHGARPRASPGRRDHDAERNGRRRGSTSEQPRARATWTAPTWPRTRPASSPAAYAINPVNGEADPHLDRRLRADGLRHRRDHGRAGHDERDFEFARTFDLPIVAVVLPPTTGSKAHRGPRDCAEDDRPAQLSRRAVQDERAEMRLHRGLSATRRPSIQSGERRVRHFTRHADGRGQEGASPPGWRSQAACGRSKGNESTTSSATGSSAASATGASRFRSCTTGRARPADRCIEPSPNRELPVLLPELDDFKPTGKPEPPLGKATDWVNVTRDGKRYRRETNTMPQWAGSCWYYLRYLDPRNDQAFCDPRRRSTGCRSTSTSAAPSTPCCTCSTAASGTRSSSIAATSARPSRSRAGQPGDDPGRDGIHRLPGQRRATGLSARRC